MDAGVPLPAEVGLVYRWAAMHNPIRLKNLRLRFLPFFVLGGAALVLAQPSPLVFVLGAGLVVAGAVLRSWGAGHLVKNDRLTITGPYARIRHPLYAGTLMVAAGFAIIAGGIFSLLLLLLLLPWFLLAYVPRKDRIESARLEALYGEEYVCYRDAVPALWPRLVAWHPPDSVQELGDANRAWSGDRYTDNNELGTLLALTVGLLLFIGRAWFR